MPDQPSRDHEQEQERAQPDIVPITPADLGLPEEGGDSACYAHLVCRECGSVVTEGHRPGCSEAPAD